MAKKVEYLLIEQRILEDSLRDGIFLYTTLKEAQSESETGDVVLEVRATHALAEQRTAVWNSTSMDEVFGPDEAGDQSEDD